MRTRLLILSLIPLLCVMLSPGASAQQSATCERTEKTNPESDIDPIIIETCDYKGIRVISTGTPDRNGRYFRSREVYSIREDTVVETGLPELFGKNADTVAADLNRQLEEEYRENMKRRGASGCMSSVKLREFSLSEFEMDLTERQVNFWVSYDASSACLPVAKGLASMSYDAFDRLRTRD